VKFTKPALSTEEQADLLLSRGIEGDLADLIRRLATVSYYRLSGYSFPYRLPDDNFRPGTTFRTIWEHYVFDRKLRLLVMDAVERVEVAVRTLVSYKLAHQFGPFGYVTNPLAMSAVSESERQRHQLQIIEEVRRNGREQFVAHFFDKYGDEHAELPIWMVTEVLSFGSVVRLLNDSHRDVRNEVAGFFGVPEEVFLSWLRTLNFVRNVCAHHGRLWNRELAYRPKLPRAHRYPDWHRPVLIGCDRVFAVLSICRYCLRKIAVGSSWGVRLRELLAEYPQIRRCSMGFPDNWEESPIWDEIQVFK
jgi:abortive infection bacteriophage resistance protein